MSREKFLFTQSARLYKQSEDLADFLLDTFVKDDAPFRETLAILEKAGASRMEDFTGQKTTADLAWNYLVAVGGALDPRSVIPALLETIEQYYYGPDHFMREVPWLGTAMKTAVAVVWKNHGSMAAQLKAKDQVRRLVAAAGAWEQLNLYGDQIRALGFGTAKFRPQGIELNSDEDDIVRSAWNDFASKRGLANRTLQDCRSVIWNNAVPFMEAVSEVLAGEKPSRIALFHGTVFEEIQNLPEFWLGLSARLQLMAHSSEFRSLGRENRTTGISVFETFAFMTRFLGTNQAMADAVSQAMFWQRDWHDQRLKKRDYLSNMLVERPAIRIDDRTFVVATTNIGDSINCFVEHSVFRCMGYGGVPVSEEAFRRYVSQPFEDRVLACFTDLGWKADHVTESGTWLGINLSHIMSAPMPGEVDVLALHPSGRIAILAECKVLASPFTPSKLLNVAQKLGPVDSESFHSKLQRKAKWLRETPFFNGVALVPMLVVDESAFMGRKADNLVIDIQTLPRIIAECDQEVMAQPFQDLNLFPN